jgi:hypothetical protein
MFRPSRDAQLFLSLDPHDLMRSNPADLMRMRPISTRVNEDASLIEPIETYFFPTDPAGLSGAEMIPR